MSKKDKTKTQLDENDISKEMCGDNVAFIQSVFANEKSCIQIIECRKRIRQKQKWIKMEFRKKYVAI